MAKKRALPPHIVLPDGRWRFVKKSKKGRVKTSMARRRKTGYRTRYIRAARRGYSRRKGLLGGNTGNILIGAVAGAASNMIPDIIGPWTKPLVFGAGGYILKKPALLTIAGYEAGKQLSANLFGGGNGSSGGYI